MLRLIVVAVCVGIALGLVRHLLRQGKAVSKTRGQAAEPLVQCAHCGTYVPRAEALTDAGKSYCSSEHLRAAQRTPP